MFYLRGLLIRCLVLVGCIFVSLQAGFVEKTISVVVQQAPVANASGVSAARAPSTKTITVGELSLFSLRRTSFLLSGSQAPAAFIAPYYYATTVTYYNQDGTQFKIDGKPLTAIAFLAIAYKDGAWMDVSGVPIDGNGVRRFPFGIAAKFSDDAGKIPWMQALFGPIQLDASMTTACMFGTTIKQTAFLPGDSGIFARLARIYPLSAFDLEILTRPALFFTPEGRLLESICTVPGDFSEDPIPADLEVLSWGKNTLPSLNVDLDSSSSSSTVELQIAIQSGDPKPSYVKYNIPKASVYQVMKPFPFTTPAGKVSTVRQYYASTLSNNQIAVGPDRGLPPFQSMTSFFCDMQLFDYYLKLPNESPERGALFVALQQNGPGQFITAPVTGWSAKLSADSSQILIQGHPLLKKEGLAQMYVLTSLKGSLAGGCSSLKWNRPLMDFQQYYSLLGSDAAADISKKQSLYQQMQSQYVATCAVVAATEQFFGGQVAFNVRSLDQIDTITQGQIQANPLSLVSFWGNALYGNAGGKMPAVLQDGSKTPDAQKQWVNPEKMGGMVQVRFTTVNPSIAYDGVMIFPSWVAAGGVPYYRTDLISSVAQFWFIPSAGIVTQLALTFDATTITGATIATADQVKKLAVGTSNPLKAFAEKANDFWGLIPSAAPAQAKKQGLSDLQKTQIGLGAGLGVAGLFGAYQMYKRYQD